MNPEFEGVLDAIASVDPTPGGGSVAALAGAMAASLGTMVLRLTRAKGSGSYAGNDLDGALAELENLRAALQAGYDHDSGSYEAVMAAYHLPQATPEERVFREGAVAKALEGATRVPLETARQAAAVLARCAEAVDKGHPQAVTDAGVGAALAFAAVTGALYNVDINTSGLEDHVFVASVRHEAAVLRHRAASRWQEADAQVRRALDG